jgi:hypothetical protein
MKLIESINSLCKPSYIYLVVSIVVMIIIVIQNLLKSNIKKLCLGPFSCSVPNVIIILIIKLITIVLWTMILDALCKYGLTLLSWILIIIPFILSVAMVIFKA